MCRILRAHGDYNDVRAKQSEPAGARALLEIYDEALPVVYGYFVRRCASHATAEDLTSETFMAAMAAPRSGQSGRVTLPWLIGIARHKLADHLRGRHGRLTVLVPEVPDADSADGWDAEVDRILAEHALSKLSGPHRAVLTFRYLDDCSVDQCAELMGRTVQATEALLVRARREFRQEYPNRGAL